MNTRSLRRHSNLSYAETSDLDFDSGMDTEDPTGSFGESGLVLQNPSPSSASERMVDDNLVTKKRISRACDYCRRKKCKVYFLNYAVLMNSALVKNLAKNAATTTKFACIQ
jgi:hypothetical protein